jgi:phosphatidylinositol alpha-1,6-mannosyltransferase
MNILGNLHGRKRYQIVIGRDYEYLRKLARQEKVSDRVHLLGQVSMDEIPHWYNACELFAMPNREINKDTEGFGIVFLEAAACSKPAVAGKAGGTGDAVIDGVTGLRVDGSSLQEVIEALGRLLSEPAWASLLGKRGYSRAVSEFSWDRVAERTLNMQLRGKQT